MLFSSVNSSPRSFLAFAKSKHLLLLKWLKNSEMKTLVFATGMVLRRLSLSSFSLHSSEMTLPYLKRSLIEPFGILDGSSALYFESASLYDDELMVSDSKWFLTISSCSYLIASSNERPLISLNIYWISKYLEIPICLRVIPFPTTVSPTSCSASCCTYYFS